MALGRRSEERQEELLVPHDRLPRSAGHVFYRKLNQLLAEADFDPCVETAVRAALRRAARRAGRRFRRASTSACCWSATSRGSAPSGASPGGAATACRCGSFWACR